MKWIPIALLALLIPVFSFAGGGSASYVDGDKGSMYYHLPSPVTQTLVDEIKAIAGIINAKKTDADTIMVKYKNDKNDSNWRDLERKVLTAIKNNGYFGTDK